VTPSTYALVGDIGILGGRTMKRRKRRAAILSPETRLIKRLLQVRGFASPPAGKVAAPTKCM
jgi:hypothetical protein